MKKIIVIEDDLNILHNIHDLLEVEGYIVYNADNGKDGLALIFEIIPDLVICDIMLPGLTGYDVLTSLNNEEITAVIPFIFLTAKAERENIRFGMELGADDYITKPFKAAELLKAVETRLRKSELVKRASSEKDPEQSTQKQKLSDDGHLFVLTNNAPNFIKINQIKCITAEAEYTYVYTQKDEKLLVRKLLKDWEKLLPESSFIRIHRSTIINLNYIVKTEKWLNNSLVVHLQNINEPFKISRRFAALIKNKTSL
jgi:DNA-binding LytR/AlgR family response regulator